MRLVRVRPVPRKVVQAVDHRRRAVGRERQPLRQLPPQAGAQGVGHAARDGLEGVQADGDVHALAARKQLSSDLKVTR